jgi:S-formylglutathione hydrolase FrmB
MKTITAILLLVSVASWGQGQYSKGRLIIEHITATSLKNVGAENPTRRVTVYLPAGYETSGQRYPVIYYLHGFSWTDSMNIAEGHVDQLLDKGIAAGKIRPVIVVMPNEYTLYRGSMYTNSTLTGNWSDFTGKELVKFIDGKYRTLPTNESRGVSGHSMGGYGAFKMGMLFPDIFSSVYALSPGPSALVGELAPKSKAYKQAQEVTSREMLTKDWDYGLANVVVAAGRAFSPNQQRPPHFADLPFNYIGDSLVINQKVVDLWNRNTLVEMVDTYVENLRKLKAIKFDWGRNEQFKLVALGCPILSLKLDSQGINHYAETYIGDHGDKIFTDDGRILNDMLPFFDTYLVFDKTKLKTP